MTFPNLRPALLGSIITSAGLRFLSKASLPADAIEVRVDALLAAAEQATVERIEAALQTRKHPVLMTLRIPAEGGRRPWKAKERRDLYLRLLPQAEAIDIELATATVMQPVIDEARRLGKTIVFSAHALAKPATSAQFSTWVNEFEKREWVPFVPSSKSPRKSNRGAISSSLRPSSSTTRTGRSP